MGIINKFKPFKTPYRWIFVDPDTQRAYSALTKKELFNQIINYRDQNKLAPIQALEHVIENYLCSLPENASNCEPEKLKRGWMSFIKGGVAVLENIFYGEKNMVSQEEADRRSEICLQCPNNVFPDRGGFVKWTDEVAEE